MENLLSHVRLSVEPDEVFRSMGYPEPSRVSDPVRRICAEQIERLSAIIGQNELEEVTVAHMQVPCCTGILHAVLEARRRAGSSVPVISVVIGVHGDILERREVVAAGADF